MPGRCYNANRRAHRRGLDLSDIFVSYSSDDRERVRPIVEALESLGFSVWWDQSLQGGSMFSRKIEEELENASAVIAVWSRTSINSRWVADEAELALKYGKLVPITLDPIDPPIGFRQIQSINFEDWHQETDSQIFSALLSSIQDFTKFHQTESAVRPAPQQTTPSITLPGSLRAVSFPTKMAVLSVIVTLLIMVPVVVMLLAPQPETGPTAGATWSSIAVMPFANLSGDPKQEYFSDGISEEILNVLAGTEGLKVAARTSSFSFKGQNFDIREIGTQLGVETVLEGSVRKSGTSLRIAVQLIDVSTGFQIWSETYDQEIDDIFRVQDDISRKVTSEMSIHFVGLKTSSSIVRVDPEAYNDLLAGRHQLNQRTTEAIYEANRLFGSALEGDSSLAAAYVGKAEALTLLYSYGDLPISDTGPQILSLIETALRLSPELSEALAVRGLYHSTNQDYEKAIADLKASINQNANLARSHMWLANAYRRLGRYQDHYRETEIAFNLDPLHPAIMNNKMWSLKRNGRYDEAMVVLKRYELLHNAPLQKRKALEHHLLNNFLQGKIAEAYEYYQELKNNTVGGLDFLADGNMSAFLSFDDSEEVLESITPLNRATSYFFLGRASEAREAWNSIPIESNNSLDSQTLLAVILALEGDPSALVLAFEQDRVRGSSEVGIDGMSIFYAWALSQLGQEDEAELLLLNTLAEVNRQKANGLAWWMTAEIESSAHVLRGDPERAIDVLENAYKDGMRHRVWRQHPLLAPLGEHPGFIALFDRIEKDYEDIFLDEDAKDTKKSN